MLKELKNPNGTCDAGIGSITITLAREEEGIIFSYPIMSSGLGIAVRASAPGSKGWAWIQPFSWDLWLAVGITILIFPILLFVIEFGSLKRRIHRKDLKKGLMASTTRTLVTLMSLEPLEVSAFGAKVAALFFLFMALILINTYTANLAAVLTVNKISSSINSVEQLRGKAVATNDIYIPRLRARYGIIATEVETEPEELMNLMQEIIAANLAAVITDAPSLWVTAPLVPNCQVRVLQQEIEPFSYGIAFKPGTNETIISNFSEFLLTLQEEGDLERLIKTFLNPPTDLAKCEGGTASGGNTAVTFYSLYGLWVLLGGSLVFGLFCMLIAMFRRHRRCLKRDSLGMNESDIGRNKIEPMPARQYTDLGDIMECGRSSNLTENGELRVESAVSNGKSIKKPQNPSDTSSAAREAEFVVRKWQDVAKVSALQRDGSIFGSYGNMHAWRSGDDIEDEKERMKSNFNESAAARPSNKDLTTYRE